MMRKLQRIPLFSCVLLLSVGNGCLAPAAASENPSGVAFGKTEMASDCRYDSLETQVKVRSFQKTTISWKKKKVDEYVVSRLLDGGTKSKKIAVLSGNRTSYTLQTKKNEDYNVEVKGWVYKKGTKKLVVREYRGENSFFSGVCPVGFYDYSWAEDYFSTKKITISFYADSYGMEPDGYQIFRKKSDDKKYSKVKAFSFQTSKKKKASWMEKLLSWTDHDVKAHETYAYKVRFYKKIGRKVHFGPFSEKMSKSAVNMCGAYTISGKPDRDAPVLKVKGKKDNGTISFQPSFFMNCGYGSREDEKVCYRIKAVSLDGQNWITKKMKKKASKDISLECDAAFWLKLEKADRTKYDEEDYPAGDISLNGIYYQGIPSYLTIYPYDHIGRTWEDSEAVH